MDIMRNHIVAPFFLLLFGLLVTDRASAQETALDVATPPKGTLTAEQLRVVAADIRRLEEHPLAPDAKEATSILMQWAIESPDVSLSICTGVTEGLVKSKSTYHAQLLVHFILASAAYVIENPDHPDDTVMVNVGGLEGAIRAYRAMKELEGDSAKDKFMEKMLKVADEGKLKEHVVKGLEEC